MKRMKKLFAILMTMAMVMGLSITGFAAQVTDVTSSITVTNLAKGLNTTVRLLNVVYYDKTTDDTTGVESQSWKIVPWAESYIDVDESSGEFVIKEGSEENFKLAAETAAETSTNVYDTKTSNSGADVVFNDVPVGAYVVLASDSKNTYNLMLAQTYDNTQTYMAAKNTTVVAKPQKYINTKTDNVDLVKRGQEVTFTVTSFVPAKSKTTNGKTENLSRFTITDTPVGLQITSIEDITIGAKSIKDQVEIKTVEEGTEPTWNEGKAGTALITNTIGNTTTVSTKSLVIDLFDIVKGDTYAAGSTITITYKAIVMDEEGYNNKVASDSNTVDYEPAEENGFEANISVNKVDEKGAKLTGAKFEVTQTGTEGKLSFVKMSDGVYQLALANESSATTTVEVGAEENTWGILQLKGLAEGTYTLTEIEAPDGYSGGATKTVTITLKDGGDSADDIEYQYGDDSQNIVNTKLTALPSTGGMGTTLFTIAGCVIMISAAGLFFATRKKAN